MEFEKSWKYYSEKFFLSRSDPILQYQINDYHEKPKHFLLFFFCLAETRLKDVHGNTALTMENAVLVFYPQTR